MDALTLLNTAYSCIKGEKPPCACLCPLGVDVRGMVRKIKEKSFTTAYKQYGKTVVFPEIVSRICDQPCQANCVRKDIDAPIELRALEKSLIDNVKNKNMGSFYIPPKTTNILVVGGGLTGMTCAVKLAQRGYRVKLVEQSDRLGGRLWEIDEKTLPRDVITQEIAQVTKLDYLNIKLGEKVLDIEEYSFDAALIATGENGENFNAVAENGLLYLRDGVLFGGGLIKPNLTPIAAIAEGFAISYAVENFVKVGWMNQAEETTQPCRFQIDLQNIAAIAPPLPINPESWTEQEARLEADRCLLCDCNSCIDACDMLDYFGKDPQKVLVDVNETINKTQITQKIALRQIASCTQCGLCEPACPVSIDFKEILIEARRIMHKSGSLPPAFYDFWINDMLFSNGEDAAFSFAPVANNKPRYLFFPGCQLGGSDPLYVTSAYDWLAKTFPQDVALMLQCCGAPAQWAGREELHQEVLQNIKNRWNELGKPEVILACPTCLEMFKNFLPEISVLSLWDCIAQKGVVAKNADNRAISVFDPCSSKYNSQSQQSIRLILKNAGYQLEELPAHGETARCCGYGGLIYSVNPSLVDQIVERNSSMGELDYVTYCVNCRDSFALNHKPAFHILDLLFFNQEERKNRTPPSLSQRRENRVAAKKILLKEIWDVDFDAKREAYQDLNLEIPQRLTEKMNRGLIHADNVKKTISQGELTGNKLYRPDTGSYTSHLIQGIITYWVEYQPQTDGSFMLLNVYKHRMQIDE